LFTSSEKGRGGVKWEEKAKGDGREGKYMQGWEMHAK